MESGGQGGVYNETVYRPKEQKQGWRKPANKRIIIGIVVVLLIILLIIIIAVAVAKNKRPEQALRVYPEVDGNLIHVKQGDREANKKYLDSLNGLLAGYKAHADKYKNDLYDCADRDPQLPNEQAACLFNTSDITDTAKAESEFGYDEGQPVIILQLKAPQNWKPKLYTNDTIDDLPGSDKLPKPVDYIPVTCEPKSNADIDNIGEFDINPVYGFHAKYFPNTGQPAYQAPLVAVRFKNIVPGVLVSVRCRARDPNLSREAEKLFETTLFIEVD